MLTIGRGSTLRLSIKLREVMYKKLCGATMQNLSPDQFNSLYVILERVNTQYRIVPHGVFENEHYLASLNNTKAGEVFKKWLLQSNAKISKDSNKGRKFRREINEFVVNFEGALPHSMYLSNIFTSSLVSLFMESVTDFNSTVDPNKVEELNDALEHLRNMLACMFFIELVSSPVMMENLIGVFMHMDGQGLINTVLELGRLYDFALAERA